MFGATQSNVAGRDKLNVMFDVNEALESELPLELRSRVPQSDLQSGGFSTMVTASADYARNRRRLQLSGSALTAFRDHGAPQRGGACDAIAPDWERASACLGRGICISPKRQRIRLLICISCYRLADCLRP